MYGFSKIFLRVFITREQGDKVDFSVTIRDGREVASQIYILPRHFPMEFDEISEHGTTIKSLALNNYTLESVSVTLSDTKLLF